MPEDPPVSVKAALRCGNKWVLLRNERNEWELPGGRVDSTDVSLEAAVRRECCEELGIDVEVGELIDAYLFEVVPGRRVTVVCFAATADASAEASLALSDEHTAVGLFTVDELEGLAVPVGYRTAIERALAKLS